MLKKTYKSTILYTTAAISFILIFAVPSINKISSFAYPVGPAEEMKEKGYNFGQIVGMVQDGTGKTEWLISGHFKTNIVNNTQFNQTNKAVFYATLHMVKPDGVEKHMHEISNFVLTETTKEGNNPVYKGTATVMMSNGPVNDVPVTLKVDNRDVINIMLEKSKLESHFGEKPIFGIVVEPMKLQEKLHKSMTTTSSTSLENEASK